MPPAFNETGVPASMRPAVRPAPATMMRRAIGRLVAVLCVFALVACAQDKTYDPTANWTADRLYKEAKGDLDSGNWAAAIKTLQKLESRYPFGRYSQQAQLDIAYANYRSGERPEALAAVDRFIRLNPTHPRLDYAYYLKGLINFNSQDGVIARIAGQDLSERDQQSAREAWEAFRQVVTRFPDGPYARDSVDRMSYLVNNMATAQLRVAQYYFDRGAYVAAVNRAQMVIEQYPRTPAVRDALALLGRSYDRLGLNDLGDDARRVLERTYANADTRASTGQPADPAAREAAPPRLEPLPIDQIPNATDPLDPKLRDRPIGDIDGVPRDPSERRSGAR